MTAPLHAKSVLHYNDVSGVACPSGTRLAAQTMHFNSPSTRCPECKASWQPRSATGRTALKKSA
eukprot:6213701-Pleurochrysis_carterae.AAC.1